MDMKKIINQKGVTLIEIIVTTAIIGIVIAASFSLFSFGNTSFNRGTAQYAIQADSRTVSDYVQEVLRYATYVEIIDRSEVETALDLLDVEAGEGEDNRFYQAHFNYVYFDNVDGNVGRVIHKVVDPELFDEADTTVTRDDYIIQFRSIPTVHSLSFGKTDDQTLTIKILGVDEDSSRNVNQTYTLTSDILLPNLSIASSIFPDEEDLTDENNFRIAIRYSTEFSYLDFQFSEGVNNGETTGPFAVETIAGDNNEYFVLTFNKKINEVKGLPTSNTNYEIKEEVPNAVRFSDGSNNPGYSGSEMSVVVSDIDDTELTVKVRWSNSSNEWRIIN